MDNTLPYVELHEFSNSIESRGWVTAPDSSGHVDTGHYTVARRHRSRTSNLVV
jgi:hypothetical protein